jgi:hypothetical protein
MTKFIKCFILSVSMIGIGGHMIMAPNVAVADNIDLILKAKDIVRNMVNYPDTLVFHEFYTKVSGNTVTLKFSCKNAFGVSETHVMDIKVR